MSKVSVLSTPCPDLSCADCLLNLSNSRLFTLSLTPSGVPLLRSLCKYHQIRIYQKYPDIRSVSSELGSQVDIKQVNLLEGKNFEPSFLELNPEATLPTLVAGSNVYTDTTAVVSYLNNPDGSSPKVAKATDFTTLLHEGKYDPNFALLLAVCVPLTRWSGIRLT